MNSGHTIHTQAKYFKITLMQVEDGGTRLFSASISTDKLKVQKSRALTEQSEGLKPLTETTLIQRRHTHLTSHDPIKLKPDRLFKCNG